MTRHLVISGGPLHDFAATSAALADLLVADGFDTEISVGVAEGAGRLGAERWDLVTVNALRWQMLADRYDGLRDEWAGPIGAPARAAIDRHVRDGGGLLALHTAVICFDDWPGWHDLVGATWDWAASNHPPLGPVEIDVTPAAHPVTDGIAGFELVDEVYGWLAGAAEVEALCTARHGGVDHPVLWAREVGSGRVVTDTLGHDPSSITHPVHATILRRAARWAARRAGATTEPGRP